jgi:hypothetical protein
MLAAVLASSAVTASLLSSIVAKSASRIINTHCSSKIGRQHVTANESADLSWMRTEFQHQKTGCLLMLHAKLRVNTELGKPPSQCHNCDAATTTF